MNAACNASPLIVLAKAGLLELLPALFEQVVVPQAVVAEITAGGAGDPAVKALRQAPWLQHVSLEPGVSALAALQLGRGEAEVIEWALRHPDHIALLDDRAARRVASVLGVQCAGTLRVLFEASRRGLLPSFAAGVQRLRDAGLYFDERTVQAVVRQAGGAE